MKTFSAGLIFIGCFSLTVVYSACDSSFRSGDGASGANSTLIDAGACVAPQVELEHTPGYARQTETLHTINQQNFPLAKCNDGTAPPYVVRPGFGAAKNRWVVYFEGGGYCYDLESCTARAALRNGDLVSNQYTLSRPEEATIGGGIQNFSPDINPDFHDASMIRVFYCSSDLWSGDRPGVGAVSLTNPDSWNFMGREIVRAVVSEAKALHGMDEATEVMLVGSSAGGIGVVSNVNAVKEMFAPTVRVVGVVDGGFPIIYSQFDPATQAPANPPIYPQRDAVGAGAALWNFKPDPLCAQYTAQRGEPVENCLSPAYLMTNNVLRAPLFIRHSLPDTNFLNHLGVSFTTTNPRVPLPAAASYVAGYTSAVRQALNLVPSHHTVFAVDEYSHVMITSASFSATSYVFNSPEPSVSTVQAAVSTWYKNPCSGRKLIQ